jgi:hypothetical protein
MILVPIFFFLLINLFSVVVVFVLLLLNVPDLGQERRQPLVLDLEAEADL